MRDIESDLFLALCVPYRHEVNKPPLSNVPALMHFATTESKQQGQVIMDCRPQELIDLRKSSLVEQGVYWFSIRHLGDSGNFT